MNSLQSQLNRTEAIHEHGPCYRCAPEPFVDTTPARAATFSSCSGKQTLCPNHTGQIPTSTPDLVTLSAAPLAVTGSVCIPQAFIHTVGPQSCLLQFPASDTKVPIATPVKRRGKACPAELVKQVTLNKAVNGGLYDGGWMCRGRKRGGTNGKKSARSPDQEPIQDPHVQRRAREIIAESGADTVEYFNKVVRREETASPFQEQAKRGLNHVERGSGSPLHLQH